MRLPRLLPCLTYAKLFPTILAVTVGVLALGDWCTHGADAGEPPSWIFRRSQFSHDPQTGARVAQYSRIRPVEPLPDPRLVTSGYRRTRSNLRGPDGSVDSYYSVSSYGNGLGGLDAEWERFHDAWLQSFTAGGSYLNARAPLIPQYGFGSGYGTSPWGPPSPAFPPVYGTPPQVPQYVVPPATR